MDKSFTALRINTERFRANLEALAEIGATPEGGVHRPALSESHCKARQWFLQQAQQIGLDTQIDGAGNHSILLKCGSHDEPTFLLGSHLDSVPYGGRFDGALGVVAALEVLQVVKEHGLLLKTHLEAIDFTDEEARYVGLLGSQALSGILQTKQLKNPYEDSIDFVSILAESGLSKDSLLSAGRTPSSIAGYLELHIEQGMQLIGQKTQIGIVSYIVGIRSFKIKYTGQADHAGTTPMNKRRDAAQGACAFTRAARDLVMKKFPDSVVNVGNMKFEPGVYNVVPQQVSVALEFRSSTKEALDKMEELLLKKASEEAKRFKLNVEFEKLENTFPTPMNKIFQEAIATACKTLGLKYIFLPSGAGHDGQSLAHICPVGMIFIPSAGGYSHSPKEFSSWEDCLNGANAILQTTLKLTQ